MMDFLLHGKDLSTQNGDLLLCSTDADAIAQAIKIRLKTLEGEWFLDSAIGVPYLTEALGQKGSFALVRRLILPQIESLAGVKSVSDFRLELDAERSARVEFVVALSNHHSIKLKETMELIHG